VTWQARGLWPPGPRQSAVVAGPRLAESARCRVYGRPGAGYMVGRGRDLPGSVTRQTDRLRSRSDSLLELEAAWSRQFIYVYSFMRIRHLGFFLIDLFSDYKTDRLL
jgi:hypothetical protein